MLASMTRAEKAQLLQWLVSDLGDAFPGIGARAGVSSNSLLFARASRCRCFEQAQDSVQVKPILLRAYPTLRAQDLANAWNYVQSHREEIEQQIAENESDESRSWQGSTLTRTFHCKWSGITSLRV